MEQMIHRGKYTDANAIAAMAANTHRASITRTSNYSVPDASGTYIPWQSEDIDVGNTVDIGGQPTRITMNKTGFYYVMANLYWSKNANAGYVNTKIQVDRTGRSLDFSVVYVGANEDAVEKIIAVVPMTAGEFVEVRAYQNCGIARSLNWNYCHFDMFFIA